MASEILAQARSWGLDGDIDLGATAAATDLRQTVRGREDPKKIQPHRTALVNWDGDRRWRPTYYPMPMQHHGTTFSLESPPRDTRIHTLDCGPLTLPIAIQPTRGDVLTVLFQGAVDRAKLRLPTFVRWTSQLEMNAGPTMAVADPTLDLSSSMRLGWYLGTGVSDLVPRIAKAVKNTAEALGATHIVLVGSSGGGFAALQVGACLPQAVVVAMSPQTDLRKYSTRLVQAALEPALGLSRVTGKGIPARRLSVAIRNVRRSSFPRVELISNPGDQVHVKHHERPLRQAYAAAGHTARFTTTKIDLGPGHRSLDNSTYRDVMSRLYDSL